MQRLKRLEKLEYLKTAPSARNNDSTLATPLIIIFVNVIILSLPAHVISGVTLGFHSVSLPSLMKECPDCALLCILEGQDIFVAMCFVKVLLRSRKVTASYSVQSMRAHKNSIVSTLVPFVTNNKCIV